MQLVSLPVLGIILVGSLTQAMPAQSQQYIVKDADVAKLLTVLNSAKGSADATQVKDIVLSIDRRGKAKRVAIATRDHGQARALEQKIKRCEFTPANGLYKERKIRLVFKG